jgi:precorrin-6A/cobalt-precorrin-6A reductase
MSRHAAEAAVQAGIPCLAVIRPPWLAQPGDRWTHVASMTEAATALGATPRRVFLTIGQQELAPFRRAPWHDYLIRSVEPPDPESVPDGARCIAARGPFTLRDEVALLARHRIETLVTKNAGGGATAAKLAAARALGLEVVMVARPPAAGGPSVADAQGALAWLRHQALARRGV